MLTTSKSRRTITEGQINHRLKLQKTNSAQTRKVTPIESRRKDKDIVVCITNLSEQKNELHEIVTKLGGRFTGELNTAEVTHLIANAPQGSKYEAALESDMIWIVKPSWLIECKEMNKFISTERNHLLVDGVIPNNICQLDDIVRGPPPIINNAFCNVLAKDKIEKDPYSSCRFIVSTLPMSDIFSKFYFYVVVVTNTSKNDFDIVTAEKPTSLWYSIGKAIRHGGGTHVWNLNALITHVIVLSDNLLDYETRNAISQIEIHHPNMPVIITLDWLIMSIQNNSLQPYHWFQLSDKPQMKKDRERKKSLVTNKKNDKSRNVALKGQNSIINESSDKPTSFGLSSSSTALLSPITKSTLFQDYIFYTLPLSPLSTKLNDKDQYSKSSLENDIVTNGGILLSLDTIDIMKIKIQTKQRLRLHIVHSNGEPIIESKSLHDQINQLLPKDSSSTKILSSMILVPVTSVWIKSCLYMYNKENQKKQSKKLPTQPWDYPAYFQPQSWKVQSIPSTIANTFKVSISGFVGVERVAIAELLQFMNIPFTDTLQKNNTHLIHPNRLEDSVRNGSKFQRALEWNLFVVKLDWIYYVMKNGYTNGCEEGFIEKRNR